MLALSACATPIAYGPIGSNGFGYSDRPNPDGGHTVMIVASTAQQAQEFWNRRASELCAGGEYQQNIFRRERPVVTATGYAVNAYNPSYGASYTYDTYGSFVMEGYLRCEQAAQSEPTSDDTPPATP